MRLYVNQMSFDLAPGESLEVGVEWRFGVVTFEMPLTVKVVDAETVRLDGRRRIRGRRKPWVVRRLHEAPR